MKKNVLFPVACILMAAPLLSSCQDDADSSAGENSNIYTYSLVADASDALQQSPATRALSEDASHKLTSKWAEKDEILAYVVDDGLQATSYSTITNKDLGNGNRFDGDIASKNAITTRSKIAFLYPGKAATGDDKTIIPVVENKERTSLYHVASDKTQELVELNLTQQDGTAETIGKRFDFQWSKQSPKTVKDKKIDVNIGKMKRIVTIWGLRFTDNNNQPLANIDSIYISNVKGSDIFNLNSGTFVDNNFDDERTNIVIKPAQGKTLTSVGGKYTYAAFIPGSYTDVVVMAFVGNKIYQRTFNSINFDSDNIYRSDLLKMDEAKQKSFVMVQGVRWATGNFIHYQEGTQEYWGIAPTQWWISKRAMYIDSRREETTSGGTLVSSQFASGPAQTADDVDLFRFGEIDRALNLRTNTYKSGNLDIAKKLYVGDGPGQAETTDRSKAKNGDIVWYYTMNNHRKYRYPTEAELLTLYDEANVEPAYCYTDKGTVVYGAYYTTNNAGSANRNKAFPTGVRAYDKYKNVTALVRANIGLFLPITGRRLTFNHHIGLRDMTWGQGAYGQYMSSKSAGLLVTKHFVFGPSKWGYEVSGANKAQASAIRPVLDSDDGQKDPAFAPFANIK